MKTLLLMFALMGAGAALARDPREAASPLHAWFESLASGHGLCCSFADGRTVESPDWGTTAKHYWVIVDGEKLVVPDDALVRVPNRYGRAVVWPYKDDRGQTQIRCFMPGAGA
jgi:hypothetical protein